MSITEGDRLPALTLTGLDDQPIALASFVGKPLVLYFYPKDDTPGCTTEAIDFSAKAAEFASAGAAILGVSKDPPAKHRKFIAKHSLAIPLATDADNVVMEALGVWVEKSMYGKSYMGIDRSTFLFDAGGTLARAWRRVRVPGHVDEVLAAVRALG